MEGFNVAENVINKKAKRALYEKARLSSPSFFTREKSHPERRSKEKRMRFNIYDLRTSFLSAKLLFFSDPLFGGNK